MSDYSEKIAITTGDVNGIGAEITVKALNKLKIHADKIVLISNSKILDFYGKLNCTSMSARRILDSKILDFYGKLNSDYEIIEIPYDGKIEPGKITAQSGEFSFQSLKKACEIKPAAIVTAPVAKKALHLAGHIFNGQTEILEHFLAHGTQHAEMLFAAGNFRVLLLTRHCALKDVNLTKEIVVKKIIDLNTFFIEKLKISHPRLALCGFNPHAGEDGILGNEEKEILIPAVKELRSQNVDITNPLPADTLFVKAAQEYYNKTKDNKTYYDCYIANYHDQGLIPIKTVAGCKTVNITVGLDIIRTSPGHGTAFDIAGKNIADETSMTAAIKAVMHSG